MSPPRNCPLVHVSVAVLNDAGELLLVQEEKPTARGKWNLPGGHMEAGESVTSAALRELFEETQLDLPLAALLGVYSGPTSIRFVFRAIYDPDQTPAAGHEILAVRFAPLEEVHASTDDALVSPQNLRAIVHDLQNNVQHPLTLFTHRVPVL